jgi:hypothetical protein
VNLPNIYRDRDELWCECGNPKSSRRAQGCERCLELDQQRYEAKSPSRIVLSVLKAHRGDWVGAIDLWLAIGMNAEADRNRSYWVALRKMIEGGHVLRERGYDGQYQYKYISDPPRSRRPDQLSKARQTKAERLQIAATIRKAA